MTAALVACQPPVELPKQDALSGFEVDVNGFSFPNFGGASETAKLTPSLVARLFGPESVCASPEGACRLTPLANQWMTKVNESMRGGRCEGFAVLSGLFYQGVLSPTDFGANDAFDLNLLNRPQLSQEIAYWFSTQFLRDVVKESTRSLDGRQAVAFLSEQYRKSPVEDLYRVGMVRVGADGKVTGGHAMVATAVLIDEPEKRFRIQVYDNNHPGAARFISVDSVANTWEYEAARTPKDALSLYQGTSANRNLLYLAPLKNRTGQQRCSFCGLQAGDASAALNQIFSFGSVEVAAVDGQGNATGVVQGRFVNTLPGASLAPNFSIEPWEDPMPPIVFVPASGSTGGQSLSFRVTGTGGSDAMHMTMFGAGFSVGVSGDAPPAGASNVVTVSKGGTRVSVTHAPDAGGEFTVSAIAETADGGQTQVEVTLQLDAGYVDTSSVEVNPVTGNATVAAQGDADVQVEVAVVRSSGGDEVVIEGTTTAPAGGSLEFNISGYSADAGVLEVTVDQDGDGTPDMTVPVPNHGPSSPPAAPEGLRALPVAYNRVQLYWRDASRYEARVVVERALGAGSFTQLIELPPDTESYLDTLVVASESYRYRVRATNAYGASPWSTEASVMSPECPTGLQDRDRDGTCENACSVTICDPHATCDDASGQAVCACSSGFSGDGRACADTDECLTNNGGCGLSTAASCTNRIASPPTCVCLPGRTGSLCATLTEFIVSATNPTTHEALIDMVRDAAGNLYLAVQTDGATAYGGGVSLGARGGNDIALVSFDPAGRARWAVLLGSSAHDGAVKLAIDAADNVFIVGTARGVPFWVSASDSLGVVGGYVASYTSAGVYRWSRSVASDARSIAIGPSGNVTVSGLANGAFDYGLGTQQARGAGDLFLVTYTNDGLATLWARVYGSDPYPYAPDNSFEDMVYDATGNLYASGHLGGPNGNVGGATLPYVGQQTAVLASYTSGGVHRWSKSFAPSGPSYADSAATSIAIDGAGHLATFVRFRDSIDLGGGTLTTPSPGGVGYGGVGVGVLGVFATVDGAFVAQRPFLTGVPTIALDVRYDSAGNVLLAGNASNDGADFGAGPTRRGAFVAGYDAALNYRFSKVAIGGAYPYAQALVVADDGDIYAAGNFDNTTVSWGVGSVVESGIGNDFWLARMHPMLPVVSGLVAHYTAREPSGLTLAGSSVNVWSDLSGSGHPLAPSATSPTWLATGINGRAALDFATGRGLVSGPFPLTTDVTVLVVATWGSSPDTWGSLAHHGSRDNDWSLEQVPTASDTVHFQSQNDNTGVELVCKVGEPTLFVGIVEGNTRTLRLVDSAGDRQVSGAGVSIAAGNKALWVGRSDVGESANALIGEVVYFNRALTPAETNQLVSDLKATWGIAHP